jgi:hypothetical protein
MGGLFLASAIFFRLDVALAALVAGLFAWYRCRKLPWRFVFVMIFPLGLYLLFLLSQFGRIVPDTLTAKAAELQYTTAGYTTAQWRWLLRCLPLSGAIILLLLAAWGMIGLVRRDVWQQPLVPALITWLLLHEITYRFLGVPFAPWYHEATLMALLALATFGAFALSEGVVPQGSLGRSWVLLLVGVTITAPLLIPSVAYTVHQWKHPPDPRFRIYAEIGEFIRRESAPGDVVAAVEIGVLGYVSQRSVLDLMGLVDPEVLAARRAGQLAELVAKRAPRFVVDAPLFRSATLDAILTHPHIRDRYVVRATFRRPEYAYGGTVRLLERDGGHEPDASKTGAPSLGAVKE